MNERSFHMRSLLVSMPWTRGNRYRELPKPMPWPDEWVVNMCKIASMSSSQKSKEPFCRTYCVQSCGSNFPGLGTRQTNTQTDIQPISRNWLLDPRVHQHPFKAWQRKWKPYLITTTEFNRGNVNIHFDPDYKCRSPSIQTRWKCIMTHIPDWPWPWLARESWIPWSASTDLNSVLCVRRSLTWSLEPLSAITCQQHCSLTAVQRKTARAEQLWWPEFDLFGCRARWFTHSESLPTETGLCTHQCLFVVAQATGKIRRRPAQGSFSNERTWWIYRAIAGVNGRWDEAKLSRRQPVATQQPVRHEQ